MRRQFEALDATGVLVAPYISREMAEHCRRIDQQFIDTQGNAYLRGQGMFVYVAGERNARDQQLGRASKGILNAASLRVAFVLLCGPDLVKSTFKEIAAAAGVSLGTANNTVDELERRGYLINKGSSQRRTLLEPRRLLDEWVINYPASLRPKLHRRSFSPPDREWWIRESLEGCDAVWGGEVGAHELTRYLKPATQTLYINPLEMDETVRRLVRQHRLTPDSHGSIEVLEKFWPARFEPQPGVAPPILVYSELLALLDPRANETAAMIRKKWIDPTFD